MSTHHLAHYRVGAELAKYVRSLSGQGVPSVSALQAVVADIAATTPNLATPLRELVSRQAFQSLIPLAGSGRGELQLKALLEDICQLYHPDIVQMLTEVLNGFLGRDEGRSRLEAESEKQERIPEATPNRKKVPKREVWKPYSRSQITGIAIGLIGIGLAKILATQHTGQPRLERAPQAEQQQSTNTTVNPVSPVVTTFPLTVAEPSEAQLKDLLEAWLEGKYRLLEDSRHLLPPPQSGYPSLHDLARSTQVEKLEQYKERNDMAGITETVNVSLERFRVIERSPNRAAAQVTLRYSDEQKDRTGKVLGLTPSTLLTNTYVFVRDNGRWLIAAYKSD